MTTQIQVFCLEFKIIKISSSLDIPKETWIQRKQGQIWQFGRKPQGLVRMLIDLTFCVSASQSSLEIKCLEQFSIFE